MLADRTAIARRSRVAVAIRFASASIYPLLRSRWRLCRLTDAACPLRVVSALYGVIQPHKGTGAPPHPPDVSFRGAKRRTWGVATADQISSRDLGRWLQESAPPSPSPRRPDPHPPRTREREYPRTCPQAPLPFSPSPRSPRPGGAAFRPLSHPGGLGRKLRRLRSPPDTRVRTYLK